MADILLTTLGLSWQIVQELFGFTNPDTLPLYRHHPTSRRIAGMRDKYDVSPVDEIWAVGTFGDKSDEPFRQLLQWQAALAVGNPPTLGLWQMSDITDLSSEKECRLMREAIFRLVLKTRMTVEGKLLLSLAGGRKTMSSDMQRAASIFGCHCLIHFIDDGRLSEEAKQLAPPDFAAPLPESLADANTPLVTGAYPASPMAYLEGNGRLRFTPARFSVRTVEDRRMTWFEVRNTDLTHQVEDCEKNTGYLITNYTNQLLQSKPAANFLALYHFSPEIIDRLKSTRIGLDPGLPKTELHRHLGGVADAAGLVDMAALYQHTIETYQDVLAPDRLKRFIPPRRSFCRKEID